MDRFTTEAIILSRTNYGDADRIVTFITPDHGKLKTLAKGVRKSRSKLAGALELFSISQIMVMPGKGEINTLMSARLQRHYGNIVKNLDRTAAAYKYIELTNKLTPDKPEAAYFHLLNSGLSSLDRDLPIMLCDVWFKAQLLKISGHMPNLSQDHDGKKLVAADAYSFNYEKMRFQPEDSGDYNVDDIKSLRLAFSSPGPEMLSRIQQWKELFAAPPEILDRMLTAYL